jgi:hypothetical protein
MGSSFEKLPNDEQEFRLPLRSSQPRSFFVISATCRPWKRACSSSLTVGFREPSGPARRDKCQDSALVPAPCSGRSKDAGDTANQRSLQPETPSLVEKVTHLRSHISKPGRRAKDNRIVLVELFGRSNRSGLVWFCSRMAGGFLGQQLRHAFCCDFHPINAAGPSATALDIVSTWPYLE